MIGEINFNTLPEDVICNIFALGEKTSLPKLQEVCQHWKKIAYNDDLYQLVLDKVAFLPKDWEKYLGVTSENSFPLKAVAVPRWVLASERIHNITFVPESVRRKIVKDDGVEEEQCLFLKTAEEVGELVANPKQGNATGFKDTSWKPALKAEWEAEKPHWVWIDCALIGQGKDYATQEELAKAKGNGAEVSGRRDSIISLLVKKVKFGECSVVFDNSKGAYIRFKDKAKIEGLGERRIVASFAPSCLDVSYDHGCDGAGYDGAVVAARKFFGP